MHIHVTIQKNDGLPHSGGLPFCNPPNQKLWIRPCHLLRFNIVGSLRDREVACSTSDLTVWMTVSSHSSYHPQKVLLAQFSLLLCAQWWSKTPFISFHFTYHCEFQSSSEAVCRACEVSKMSWWLSECPETFGRSQCSVFCHYDWAVR